MNIKKKKMKYRRLFESQLVSWAPNARFADPKNPEEVQKKYLIIFKKKLNLEIGI